MLVSLAEVKSLLGISSGNTSNDAFLTSQLILISDAVEAYTRRRFEKATYREVFYCDSYKISSQLKTYHYPVVTVTSVSQDAVAFVPGDYRVHKESGTLTRKEGFFWGDELEIIYEAGYDTIPALIKNVVSDLVSERYNKKVSGVDLSFGSDVQRISIPGSISIDYDYTLNNNERSSAFGILLGSQINILDYYRSDRAVLQSNKIEYVEVVP